jgi:Na+/H+ antiporter NhaD/arsenite permease-like protein
MTTIIIAYLNLHTGVAWAIFLASYLVFAVGRLPGTKINRPTMAVIGGTLMFAFRIVGPRQAIRSIDFETIVLLFSMMLILAALHLAGFFAWITGLVVEHVPPRHLLPSVIFTSGVLSAFLINDVVCLFMAPLILEVCRRLSKPATRYLLALAMASNIGSTATITGNPQNILIGSVSGIGYRDFLKALGPVALAGLFIAWAALHWLAPYNEEWQRRTSSSKYNPANDQKPIRRKNLIFPLCVTLAVLAGFLAGFPSALVATVGAAVLLLKPPATPKEIYKEVDWSLLILFVGLFLIIGGAEASGIAGQMLAMALRGNLHNAWVLSGVVVVLSNLVSNVPAVMLLKGLATQFADSRHFWLLLAMSSTLAGNLTITGSIANIIVVEKAKAEIHIGFREYMRVGVPITFATVLFGILWIQAFA